MFKYLKTLLIIIYYPFFVSGVMGSDLDFDKYVEWLTIGERPRTSVGYYLTVGGGDGFPLLAFKSSKKWKDFYELVQSSSIEMSVKRGIRSVSITIKLARSCGYMLVKDTKITKRFLTFDSLENFEQFIRSIGISSPKLAVSLFTSVDIIPRKTLGYTLGEVSKGGLSLITKNRYQAKDVAGRMEDLRDCDWVAGFKGLEWGAMPRPAYRKDVLSPRSIMLSQEFRKRF